MLRERETAIIWLNPETGKESGDMNEGRANVGQRDSASAARSCPGSYGSRRAADAGGSSLQALVLLLNAYISSSGSDCTALPLW
jgi:hypothetical protein